MELKDLVEEEKGKISGWVTFCEGFDIELEYVDRNTLQDMRRRCTRPVWRNHQRADELDIEKFSREIIKHIKNWRGFNGDILRKMFPLKEEVHLNGKEIPCDESNKLYMLENAYGFDEFILRCLTDLEELQQKQRGRELKNSDALSRED